MHQRIRTRLTKLPPLLCVVGMAMLVTFSCGLVPGSDVDSCASQFAHLWSCGQISIRTGLPLIFEGGEHNLDPDLISYGFNLVVDSEEHTLRSSGAPLEGGERLVLTEAYHEDHNTRQYALIVTFMAPIRDAIL